MKMFKYPIFAIAIILLLIALFWNDLKILYTKFKTMAYAKFNHSENNPFNIKTNSANKWKGKTTVKGATFESFDTLENGVRAGIIILRNYFLKYNLKTIQGIISRFAPNNENDTQNYVNFVSDQMKIAPDETITANKETLWKLSQAICKMENGYTLKREVYEKAFSMV